MIGEICREDEYYLECEKKWVFLTLMGVAGFYGAFTYSIRGGVFCNAQTANFVLFAMALGNILCRRYPYRCQAKHGNAYNYRRVQKFSWNPSFLRMHKAPSFPWFSNLK